jgi:DNA/RNA-binding domain of Phe-tRNA-synthetase-like protein
MDVRCFTAGGIRVDLATGGETFRELGATEEASPDPGEAVFVDEAGRVHARRWCWRQSAESAAREDTQAALIVIEAHHPGSQADIEGALALLNGLLAQAFPRATLKQALLGPEHPRFDF